MRIHGDTDPDPKHWSGLKEDTYKKKCNELRLETMKERREQKNLMLAHNVLDGASQEETIGQQDGRIRQGENKTGK